MKPIKLVQNDKSDKAVYLTLVPFGKKSVRIVVVNKDRKPFNSETIAIIELNGIYRCRGLNAHLGFAQDGNGRILDLDTLE